ncbi:MAG: PEP-CTERM sorting domain-containing protein, partial [Gemmatimonadetes bacterium]|nr:PEP-CTERM sorting domain-containing protein [Gemmatimonadota bacterium]
MSVVAVVTGQEVGRVHVPEPATASLLGLGLLALVAASARHRRAGRRRETEGA